ncbi:MAG: seg [archaeon GW2011_AR5]|nr:MAG: seg [archaeon GW2011_AR5]
MEMWKKVAAGLLSAALAAGADTSKPDYRQSTNSSTYGYNSGSQERQSYKSSYGDKLASWLDSSGYGSNSQLKSLFKSNIDDRTKYTFAMAFYDSFGKSESKAQAHDPGDEMVYLVPQEQSDGSFHYVNRMTGKIEVSVNRMSNGLFSYYGPVKWITRLGGRGELSGIRDSMADGKFFNKG